MKAIYLKFRFVINLTKEFIYLIALLILFFVIIHFWVNQYNSVLWAGVLVIFSLTKIYLLVSHTIKKLDKLIENNHSFDHMLLLLGAIITIIIISFALDYLCISEIYPNAFSGVNAEQSLYLRFINFLYFSIVTYTTVGYGDIIPITMVAKLITVLEMMSAFIVIVFIISKYFKSK